MAASEHSGVRKCGQGSHGWPLRITLTLRTAVFAKYSFSALSSSFVSHFQIQFEDVSLFLCNRAMILRRFILWFLFLTVRKDHELEACFLLDQFFYH